MKRLHKAIISFGIVAVLVAGSSNVFAKEEASKGRLVSGAIVRIDRSTRTITVREHGTDREVNVVVPDKTTLHTNLSSNRLAIFEELMVGMFIQDVPVR